MIVNFSNLDKLPNRDGNVMRELLLELQQINKLSHHTVLQICYQDWHDKYSPERTDPCPDYYGRYHITDINGNRIGEPMELEDLDYAICLLLEFCEL